MFLQLVEPTKVGTNNKNINDQIIGQEVTIDTEEESRGSYFPEAMAHPYGRTPQSGYEEPYERFTRNHRVTDTNPYFYSEDDRYYMSEDGYVPSIYDNEEVEVFRRNNFNEEEETLDEMSYQELFDEYTLTWSLLSDLVAAMSVFGNANNGIEPTYYTQYQEAFDHVSVDWE